MCGIIAGVVAGVVSGVVSTVQQVKQAQAIEAQAKKAHELAVQKSLMDAQQMAEAHGRVEDVAAAQKNALNMRAEAALGTQKVLMEGTSGLTISRLTAAVEQKRLRGVDAIDENLEQQARATHYGTLSINSQRDSFINSLDFGPGAAMAGLSGGLSTLSGALGGLGGQMGGSFGGDGSQTGFDYLGEKGGAAFSAASSGLSKIGGLF